MHKKNHFYDENRTGCDLLNISLYNLNNSATHRLSVNAYKFTLNSTNLIVNWKKKVVTLQPKGCETAHARQLMQASLLSLNRSCAA